MKKGRKKRAKVRKSKRNGNINKEREEKLQLLSLYS
jgi:hypothetical protein